MRTIQLSVLVLVTSLFSNASHASVKTADLPWEDIARQLETTVKSEPDAKAATAKAKAQLDQLAPEYLAAISREGKVSKSLKKIWGRSINFDANAKAIIIPEPILDLVLETAGVPPRGDGLNFPDSGRIAHAGFEHTYGYLLSNLNTPYGYKRLRWVRPDIEKGLGLPEGTIVPLPQDGGLFSNVSVLAGSIAFRTRVPKERAAYRIIRDASAASPAVRNYDYSKLGGVRLVETVLIPNAKDPAAAPRKIELRTDYVTFLPGTESQTNGNGELLVYSVSDSAMKYPYIISTFPVAAGTGARDCAPEKLGDAQPIKTVYNGFVAGMTDTTTAFTGKRACAPISILK